MAINNALQKQLDHSADCFPWGIVLEIGLSSNRIRTNRRTTNVIINDAAVVAINNAITPTCDVAISRPLTAGTFKPAISNNQFDQKPHNGG